MGFSFLLFFSLSLSVAKFRSDEIRNLHHFRFPCATVHRRQLNKRQWLAEVKNNKSIWVNDFILIKINRRKQKKNWTRLRSRGRRRHKWQNKWAIAEKELSPAASSQSWSSPEAAQGRSGVRDASTTGGASIMFVPRHILCGLLVYNNNASCCYCCCHCCWCWCCWCLFAFTRLLDASGRQNWKEAYIIITRSGAIASHLWYRE